MCDIARRVDRSIESKGGTRQNLLGGRTGKSKGRFPGLMWLSKVSLRVEVGIVV